MFKKIFKKQTKEDTEKKDVLVCALLIHAAKMDENYTEVEKEIIKKALVYINKILHANIDVDSDEYKKYLNLSKTKITSRLFNTYDIYIKSKYKIDINKKALDAVKNYFN